MNVKSLLEKHVDKTLESKKELVMNIKKWFKYENMSPIRLAVMYYSYHHAINEMLGIIPVVKDGMYVVYKRYEETDDMAYLDIYDYPFLSVTGKVDGDIDNYALDFIPWKNVLSMEIKEFDEAESINFLSAILFEMTFSGFSQEVVDEEIEKLKLLLDERLEESKLISVGDFNNFEEMIDKIEDNQTEETEETEEDARTLESMKKYGSVGEALKTMYQLSDDDIEIIKKCIS